jgi:hypothetical protein
VRTNVSSNTSENLLIIREGGTLKVTWAAKQVFSYKISETLSYFMVTNRDTWTSKNQFGVSKPMNFNETQSNFAMLRHLYYEQKSKNNIVSLGGRIPI